MTKRFHTLYMLGIWMGCLGLFVCALTACHLHENNEHSVERNEHEAERENRRTERLNPLSADREHERDARQKRSETGQSPQNVVMIILDSMMGASVDRGLEKCTLPALQFLIENGQYEKQFVAPFPSMSVTIESTLLTGEMPDQHRIAGLAWYDDHDDRIVNYGTTWQAWLQRDFSQGAYDALFRLNNVHLSDDVSTIFEQLSERGQTSGAVNMIVYRGNQRQALTLPPLTNTLTRIPQTIHTQAPDIFAFGRFAQPESMQDVSFTDGVFNRLGLTDTYATQVTRKLIETDDLPDFLLVFLSDNDKEVHRNSPHYQNGLERADECVQDILNAYPSWEEALAETIFIIIGDHGQDKQVEDDEELAIDLHELYADYVIPALADPVSSGEVAFAVNQRMTYVFDVQQNGLLPKLAEQSQKDDRVDVAAWVGDDEWVHVRSVDHDDMLRFRSDLNGDWLDRYGQRWNIKGNMDVVSLKADEERSRIAYDTYPDVLRQLEAALGSHDVPALVLAAKPGHAFRAEAGVIYPGGGEHGGLHKNDTLAALIIAGTDERPASNRMTDIKQYVLDLLDE